MQSSQPPQPWSQWPNRILILSLIGIAYLTLFPFRFDFASPQSRNSSPFFLGPLVKHSDSVQVFLNVLLFVPFGFGFSAHLRKRGVSKGLTLVLALAAGAVTSYAVEFLQFYIPTRNSGWDDITPNTLGAVAGCLLFGQWGEMLLTPLSEWESRAETWLSLRRASIFLMAYLGIFIILSIPLQRARVERADRKAPSVEPGSLRRVGAEAHVRRTRARHGDRPAGLLRAHWSASLRRPNEISSRTNLDIVFAAARFKNARPERQFLAHHDGSGDKIDAGIEENESICRESHLHASGCRRSGSTHRFHFAGIRNS